MAGTAPGRAPQPEPRGAGAGVTAGEDVTPAPQGAAAPGEGPTGVVRGDSAVHGTATHRGTGHPAEPSAEPAAESSAEPSPALAASPASSAPATASTPPTPAGPSTSSEPPPAAAKPSGRARSAVLARSRAGERRRVAADAYRQAQREGCDPVLAVMLATGRNRRRALRLIAGARDEGLLTPRHNKR
ncbi:DUF6214 family protein [Streptomyces sp. MS1.AVA.3]